LEITLASLLQHYLYIDNPKQVLPKMNVNRPVDPLVQELARRASSSASSSAGRAFYVLRFKYMRHGKPATGVVLLAIANPTLIDICIVYTIMHTGLWQTQVDRHIFTGEGRDPVTNEILEAIDKAEILMFPSGGQVVVPTESIFTCDKLLRQTQSLFDEFSMAFADEPVRRMFQDDDYGTFSDAFLERLTRSSGASALVWKKREVGWAQGLEFPLIFPSWATTDEENESLFSGC
jgi:hypothetical protein